MKKSIVVRIIAALLAMLVLTGWGFTKKTANQERQEIQAMRQTILAELFQEAPGAKEVLEEAAGYAVFSSFGANVLLISSANGEGVLRDNATGGDTYMKMFSAGGGVGVGVKKYRLVFVFDTPKALEWFVEDGWQAGAQADAAAQYKDEGDALALAFAIAPDVYLYQMTESGLAAQLTIQGTKYWKDDDLN